MSAIDLTTTGVAAGGDAVARDDDGRVVFVDGALSGERVRVELTDERRDFARGVVVEVIDAAPARTVPPCRHVADGCGGCSWQHIDVAAQREFKVAIVADAFARIGHIEVPPIEMAPALPATGFRTTVRAAVVGGGPGFRHRRSHSVVPIDSCLVAHPMVDEILREGRFEGAVEVTVRVGVASGDRLVIAHPTAADVVVPAGVGVVGTDELRAGRRAWIHEEVGGRRWRISARSFFQARPDGADALAGIAQRAVGEVGAGRLVDLYGGVGLFAGVIAAEKATVVERSASAVHDARHNLQDLGVKVLSVPVERWRAAAADVVIADPARSGLGRAGAAKIAATKAARVVLVSCDPAALARDASLLRDRGYRADTVTLVDMFPHTANVEAVTIFTASSP